MQFGGVHRFPHGDLRGTFGRPMQENMITTASLRVQEVAGERYITCFGGMISVMAGHVVAPGITSDKYNDSMQVEAFQQRCLQWVLRQAPRLADDNESGLAILMLATVVMEA